MSNLQELNSQRWARAKLTRASEYKIPVQRIIAAKDQYLRIERLTGVHWVFVAASHYRESGLNFNTYLGNGQSLHRVTTIVPKGRGPFPDFATGAVDALVKCAPFASKNKNWSMPDMLTLLEAYNGLGYYHRGYPSAYVWSGTDQYSHGKFISDGVFSSTVTDPQLGVAGLILCLWQADPSLSFPAVPEGETPVHNPAEPLHTLQASTKPAGSVTLPAAPNTPVTGHPASQGVSEPPKAKETSFEAVWEWLRNH